MYKQPSTANHAPDESNLRLYAGVPTAFRSLPAAAAGAAAKVLLGSLFVAVCAQAAVPLPWTPVPMTMQPFGVLLVGLLLGPAVGAAAMVAYLLEGLAGLPVFVPGFGGLLPLGASAGYLLSYPLAAAVVGLLFGQGRGRSLLRGLLAGAAGSALILCCGVTWLSVITHGSLATLLRLGVLPFVAGDGVKVVLAALIAAGWMHMRRFHPVERDRSAG